MIICYNIIYYSNIWCNIYKYFRKFKTFFLLFYSWSLANDTNQIYCRPKPSSYIEFGTRTHWDYQWTGIYKTTHKSSRSFLSLLFPLSSTLINMYIAIINSLSFVSWFFLIPFYPSYALVHFFLFLFDIAHVISFQNKLALLYARHIRIYFISYFVNMIFLSCSFNISLNDYLKYFLEIF